MHGLEGQRSLSGTQFGEPLGEATDTAERKPECQAPSDPDKAPRTDVSGVGFERWVRGVNGATKFGRSS